MAFRFHCKTELLAVDPQSPDPAVMRRAGEVLKRGGLVAFPTETVYGLGASALDQGAVRRIFQAKGRPADNPLIIHIAAAEELEWLADDSGGRGRLLAQAFWPGPLTLVLPGRGRVTTAATAGLDSVAVRLPAHPVARALIRAAGVPVAAPSANLSGRPSPTTAAHVWQDLAGRVEMILDAGPAGQGVESTVLDLTVSPPLILRPGGVTREELQRVLGRVDVDPAVLAVQKETDIEQPRSPGMKYRHYAPRAPLYLFEGEAVALRRALRERLATELAAGRRVGVLCREGNQACYEGAVVVPLGRQDRPEQVAAGLYAALRYLDEQAVEIILAEGVPAVGMGLAVANRLRRAAGGNVLEVKN
ncbi:L-threonylcarbamoyladenylate synthase [Desulfurispora thermophila]|uniref:L-threonylcarbamoyladenylate synthase n=1 Tax=Desulfurispora thermophila TaxID=265470 RepID=UPI000369889A|nr:L-threonylcarbamoyladenylate synthase [Desulfurispora thermophila]